VHEHLHQQIPKNFKPGLFLFANAPHYEVLSMESDKKCFLFHLRAEIVVQSLIPCGFR